MLIWLQLAVGLFACLTLVTVTWLYSVRTKFYSAIDVAWSYGFAVVAWVYFFSGTGWSFRNLVFASMISLWSLRLGTYLLLRLKKHFPTEDGRYIELKKNWNSWRFLLFFLAQGASIVLLSLPMTLVSLNPTIQFSNFELLGIGLWAIALIGETTADSQLEKFRLNLNNKGKTCRVGLWQYSRHPNYFFEWMIWMSYFVFALGSPYGWVTIYCPLIMLTLLFRVTGIPHTEAQSLRTRGDDYRKYQQEVSIFVPWFPKKF
jgi:steroid 5-alpha reductase family enzyme